MNETNTAHTHEDAAERAIKRMDDALEYLAINVLGKRGPNVWHRDRTDPEQYATGPDAEGARGKVAAILCGPDLMWRVISWVNGTDQPEDHGEFALGEEPEAAGMVVCLSLSAGVLEQVKLYRENRPPTEL